jgi:hypothetical protein
MSTEVKMKSIDFRKPWRRTDKRQRTPLTYFASYHSRLYALAHRHGIPPSSFKALIEDAFGTCDTPPIELQAKQALMKLAKMKIGPCEINWLFQYHIVKEQLHG